MLRLIPRGDDIGMCESANLGALDACMQGVLCNVSVMATGQHLEHAARMLAHVPGICIGMHVALNCEWLTPRWGNVLPAAQVPSLVKADGTQFEIPNMLHDRGFSVTEAMAEITAQLARLRAVGFTVSYLDEHMGVGWIRDLRPALSEFAQREGLIDADAVFHESGLRDLPGEGPLALRLLAVGPGTWRVIGHPCLPGKDLQEFLLPGQKPGDTAIERDAQRRQFSAPDLLELVQSDRCRVLRFTDL